MPSNDRDMRLRVTAEEDTRALKKAGEALEDVADKSDKASKGLDGVAGSTSRVDAEIKKTEQSIKALAQEFERTGDVDIFKKMRAENRSLGMLEKVRKELADSEDEVGKSSLYQRFINNITNAGSEGGAQAGKGVAAGLQGALSTPVLGPILLAGLGAAAALAAPAVGAAVGAGVLTGIGGGALAGGIALAIQDPQVHSAWANVIDAGEWSRAADSFATPMISAAGNVSAAFDRALPGVERSLSALAPVVDTLSEGVAGFVDNIGPGLETAITTAGPFLEILADELPNIGNALSDFFGSLEAGAPGMEMFFSDALRLTEGFIVGIGNAIEFLSRAYGVASGIFAMVSGDVSEGWQIVKDSWNGGAAQIGEASNNGLGKVKAGADNARTGLEGLQRSMQQVTQEALAMQGSDLAVAKIKLNLADAIRQNGASLDTNTQKGMANREMLQQSIGTIANWQQKQLDAGKAPAYVNSQVDVQVETFRRNAVAAGFNASQVGALVDQWRTMLNLPSNKTITTTLTTISRRIDEGGVVPGTGGMRAQRFGGVRMARAGLVNLSGMAGMFPESAAPTYGFAERGTGGEVFVAKNAPHGASLAYADAAARWHGGRVVPAGQSGAGGGVTVVEVVVRDDVGRLLEVLRSEVSMRGGDVQDVLGTRR